MFLIPANIWDQDFEIFLRLQGCKGAARLRLILHVNLAVVVTCVQQ